MGHYAQSITRKQIVEAALLAHPSVDDCVVLVREAQTHRQELVAYVVSARPFLLDLLERLESHLQALLPSALLPIAYIPISSLPLTALGQVDEQALAELAVLDSDLVQRWEGRLQSVSEVEQVAVVVQEYSHSIEPYHLSEILPNWKTPSSSTSLVADSVGLAAVPQQESGAKALAISSGEPLPESAELPINLALALQRTVLEAPEKGIVYLQSDGSEIVQSYAALLEEAERILAGLRKLGLKPQDQVIFQLNLNQDFIPAFWGCMLGGFVPVPIAIAPSYESSNSTVKKLQNAWQMLEQPLILTNKELAPAVSSLSDLLGLENFQVATIDELRTDEPDSNWHGSQPDDLAVLILTSGSTGLPKGVMLSHRNILSNVAASAQMNNFQREDVSLNWLNLDHVGSLVRCSIRDIYVGSQQIHAPAETVLEDPLRWLDWIERYQVTFAWAPNFALGLVNARAEAIEQRSWDLSKVKSVLSVAEAIVPKTAKRFIELLAPHGLSPNAMHSAWGMTETCAGVTFSHRYLLNLTSDDYPFVEVGEPIPGFQMRIVDALNRVIHEDTIGSLQISGSMIASSYYQNPELNREAFTEDGWFKTGDLGFLHQGRLTVTGREKDIIIINGLNHYSHEIEAVVEEVEGVEVSYTAACAIRTPESDTDQLAVFFHTTVVGDRAKCTSKGDRITELLKEIRGNVARKIRVNPDYLIPVEKEAIPKTAIGKIQRSQLKQRFEVGEFDKIVKQLDILTGNANTLPDWFYKKIWRRKEAVTLTTQPTTGHSLVFLDQLGLGLRLCAELGQLNTPCIAVEVGSDFVKLDFNRYAIDPKNPNHYRQLFESLKEANFPIHQILHLWTYGEYGGEVSSLEALEQAQEHGVYSLLFLIQSLSQVQGSETSVRLSVISSYAQPTKPEDEIAYEKTPLLGLIKTIPQEMPWLDCRHIDLSTEQGDANAAYVLRELQVIQKEQEVAYRDGQRLVPSLEKVDLRQEQKQELPFKRGGMYLLSGGLGEIGVQIARYLLQHYEARLLLVGRTPLPERSTWSEHLKQDNAVSTRIKAYLSLEQLGGEVIYEAVDICDLPRLKQVVDQASSCWQCDLDGVIHLARITQDYLLAEETKDSFAAMLRPKVSGTWVLNQLLKNQPNAVFINFSSVVSFFGALSVGAYAAANRFLDCFSYYQRYKNSLRSYCFAWSIWEEIGMSRSYQMRDLSRARGYYTILSEQGLNSFFAGLYHDQGQLIVGLNGSNPYMRRYTETQSRSLQKLYTYFTAQTARSPVSQLQELEVHDRFGTPVRCDFLQIQQMPLTETGEIDRQQLAVTGLRTAAERVAPRTELEHELANIWQQVLGVPQVGIHDNFFELGGSSLLAVQLFAQIEKVCGKNLPLSTLIQAVTVEQMASILQEEQESALSSSLVAIQPHGSKPPLFAIHEVDGHILFYRDLANCLGSEQPFYALQPLGIDGKQAPFNRFEDMAAHYIKEIRAVQPEGPYFLTGFSLGGVLAFEMAHQLHAQGQKVALLALLDAYAETDLILPLSQRISRHLSNLSKRGPAYILQKLSKVTQKLKNKVQERLLKIVHKFDPTMELPLPDMPEAPRLSAIAEAHEQAVRAYVYKVYPGRATFFHAMDRSSHAGWEPDPYKVWGWRIAGGLEICDVPGNHVSMVQEPHVQVLAEKLRAYLEQAQADVLGASLPKLF